MQGSFYYPSIFYRGAGGSLIGSKDASESREIHMVSLSLELFSLTLCVKVRVENAEDLPKTRRATPYNRQNTRTGKTLKDIRFQTRIWTFQTRTWTDITCTRLWKCVTLNIIVKVVDHFCILCINIIFLLCNSSFR